MCTRRPHEMADAQASAAAESFITETVFGVLRVACFVHCDAHSRRKYVSFIVVYFCLGVRDVRACRINRRGVLHFDHTHGTWSNE